jgi:hypothetical protein
VEDEEHNAEDSKWGKLTEYDNPDVWLAQSPK